MPAQIPFTIMCNILIIQDKYDGRPEAGYLLKGEKNAYWNFSPLVREYTKASNSATTT